MLPSDPTQRLSSRIHSCLMPSKLVLPQTPVEPLKKRLKNSSSTGLVMLTGPRQKPKARNLKNDSMARACHQRRWSMYFFFLSPSLYRYLCTCLIGFITEPPPRSLAIPLYSKLMRASVEHHHLSEV